MPWVGVLREACNAWVQTMDSYMICMSLALDTISVFHFLIFGGTGFVLKITPDKGWGTIYVWYWRLNLG